MKFQAPKGCRDFYPEDMRIRDWIFAKWRDVSIRNGFEPYDGPIFEDLDIYRTKSGEGIVSELFHFKDRGDREFALRPEMTPTLARMIAARANALPRPIRWYSIPRLCRAERPQRGRLREFFQWNIDIVGADGPEADAECVFVMADFLREVGLTPEQAGISINSRTLLAAILAIHNLNELQIQQAYALLDKREKLPPEAFLQQLEVMGLSTTQRDVLLHLGESKGPEGLRKMSGLVAGHADGEKALQELEVTLQLLGQLGMGGYCQFDMSVVRGLAYYTGIVFEGYGKGGLGRAICGGGRYDKLLSDMGGPSMGGVGFATSDVVIQDLLEEFKIPITGQDRRGIFVIDVEPDAFPHVLHLTSELRRRNHLCNYSFKRQAIGKQMKAASGRNARRVVLVESPLWAGGKVRVKDLDSGVQQDVTVESVLENPYQGLEGTG